MTPATSAGERTQQRRARRAWRIVLAAIIGVCAWDDSSDLHWMEPQARAIAASRPARVTAPPAGVVTSPPR